MNRCSPIFVFFSLIFSKLTTIKNKMKIEMSKKYKRGRKPYLVERISSITYSSYNWNYDDMVWDCENNDKTQNYMYVQKDT